MLFIIFLEVCDGIRLKKGISDIFTELFSEEVRREEQWFVFFACWAQHGTSRYLWDVCNNITQKSILVKRCLTVCVDT